jgi:hypothetical protein
MACDLCAAIAATDTPVAEVLTVICEQVIVMLTQSRAGALHDLPRRIRQCAVLDDLHRVTERKLGKAHLLDWPGVPGTGEAGVMDDLPTADIYPMMRVPAA